MPKTYSTMNLQVASVMINGDHVRALQLHQYTRRAGAVAGDAEPDSISVFLADLKAVQSSIDMHDKWVSVGQELINRLLNGATMDDVLLFWEQVPSPQRNRIASFMDASVHFKPDNFGLLSVKSQEQARVIIMEIQDYARSHTRQQVGLR